MAEHQNIQGENESKNLHSGKLSINIVRQRLPASVLGMYIHVNTLIEIEYGCRKVYRSMHSSSLSENSWVTSIAIKKQNWGFSAALWIRIQGTRV